MIVPDALAWAIVGALRYVAAALALWNLRWSWRAAWELARGRFNAPTFLVAAVFWGSVMAISFQIGAWAGLTPDWRILSFLLLITSLALAAISNRRGFTARARALNKVAEHLSAALAITDLAEVDAAAADRLAAECRRLTVVAMVPRRG